MFSFLNPHTSLAHSGLLQGAADHHSHILYGVDDGVKTLEGSLRILDWEAAHGVTDVWCTPHIMEDVPNRTEDLQKRFQELTSAYKGPIRLHLAAEYMLDNLYLERLKNRDLLLHGQDRILVETSTGIPPYNLWEILEQTLSAGYRPILAHAERYHYLHQEDYDRLINMGVRLPGPLLWIGGKEPGRLAAEKRLLLYGRLRCPSFQDPAASVRKQGHPEKDPAPCPPHYAPLH